MAENTLSARLKSQYHTNAWWEANNPVLYEGEVGYVSDKNNIYKVGDGTSDWKSLKFSKIDWTNIENAPSDYILAGEQTTTSTEDGGSNVFSFTKADGTSAEFIVKNGSKGSGVAAGFGIPTATVDDNIGTPSVEITSSGPDTAKVFTFAFDNLKGEKGDPGTSGISMKLTDLDGTTSDLETISDHVLLKEYAPSDPAEIS